MLKGQQCTGSQECLLHLPLRIYKLPWPPFWFGSIGLPNPLEHLQNSFHGLRVLLILFFVFLVFLYKQHSFSRILQSMFWAYWKEFRFFLLSLFFFYKHLKILSRPFSLSSVCIWSSQCFLVSSPNIERSVNKMKYISLELYQKYKL